ncbi:hypothetical protein [Sulfurovum sp. NBC37-1]|uniref:hypothetical protein n=1 Tax=Sulfurovum sp. (strain NBC37-1) TaxID=387093 RepID=UPI0001587ACD|nr:hypothetical protein [Sulfurovum sp. NBC37-1]BAF72446.1 hypothetical protein SUN_1495 [Sulfurovum sp. NBC37-1]
MNVYIKSFLIGAASYWLPDIAMQLILPENPLWIILLTLVVPVIVITTWYKQYKSEFFYHYPKVYPLFMLLGIWATGPVAIAISMQFKGGTFFEMGLESFLIMWISFPVSTFIMSTYSGDLGGVIIVSLALLKASSIASKKYKASNKYGKTIAHDSR